MSKIKRLTDNEMVDIVEKISKPTYKFIKKKIEEEFKSLSNYKNLDINDLINIVIMSISTVDYNIMFWVKGLFEDKNKNIIDMGKVLNCHLSNILNLLRNEDIEELKKNIEKLH